MQLAESLMKMTSYSGHYTKSKTDVSATIVDNCFSHHGPDQCDLCVLEILMSWLQEPFGKFSKIHTKICLV